MAGLVYAVVLHIVDSRSPVPGTHKVVAVCSQLLLPSGDTAHPALLG